MKDEEVFFVYEAKTHFEFDLSLSHLSQRGSRSIFDLTLRDLHRYGRNSFQSMLDLLVNLQRLRAGYLPRGLQPVCRPKRPWLL